MEEQHVARLHHHVVGRHDLLQLRELHRLGLLAEVVGEVDQHAATLHAVEGHVLEPEVMRAFSRKHFAYSRSGIHCDLHPRWRTDGQAVCFDSNHEGRRKVHTLEIA